MLWDPRSLGMLGRVTRREDFIAGRGSGIQVLLVYSSNYQAEGHPQSDLENLTEFNICDVSGLWVIL